MWWQGVLVAPGIKKYAEDIRKFLNFVLDSLMHCIFLMILQINITYVERVRQTLNLQSVQS